MWSCAATSSRVLGRLSRCECAGLEVLDRALAYYFSTHGWRRVESSLLSLALALELLDAATAAAWALLLKNEEAIVIKRPGLEGERWFLKLVDVLNDLARRPPQPRRVST